MNANVFELYESEVRSYCRSFPTLFTSAKGAYIEDRDGKRYLDFFCGAGALSLGHNPQEITAKLIAYLEKDGILHGLDMHTAAKEAFLDSFQQQILKPRQLEYRVQFCGPTGTNGVEAALKLARKVTGRRNVFAFQGGFHGMTLGALACTGNHYHRQAGGSGLNDVTFMPYPFGPLAQMDTIAYIDAVLSDPSSGIDKPAAMLLEVIQAEGGVVVAPDPWLKAIRELCNRHQILLIVDDVQVGCGRSGHYFSFEQAAIVPDMIVLSKAISGCGLPLALVLIKPELDQWQPGEHNGTFRGNQLAFVAGTEAIRLWHEMNIADEVLANAQRLEARLKQILAQHSEPLSLRGRGMIWGIDFIALNQPQRIDNVIHHCFQQGLIIENAGRNGQVLKLLPPLNVTEQELLLGLDMIEQALSTLL